jgi:cAMP phosphodiesterase
VVAGLFLSVCTLITMFLYMVAELSALQQIVTLLTGLNGLPVVIVECVVTTIYTCKARNLLMSCMANIEQHLVVSRSPL